MTLYLMQQYMQDCVVVYVFQIAAFFIVS